MAALPQTKEQLSKSQAPANKAYLNDIKARRFAERRTQSIPMQQTTVLGNIENVQRNGREDHISNSYAFLLLFEHAIC